MGRNRTHFDKFRVQKLLKSTTVNFPRILSKMNMMKKEVILYNYCPYSAIVLPSNKRCCSSGITVLPLPQQMRNSQRNFQLLKNLLAIDSLSNYLGS